MRQLGNQSTAVDYWFKNHRAKRKWNGWINTSALAYIWRSKNNQTKGELVKVVTPPSPQSVSRKVHNHSSEYVMLSYGYTAHAVLTLLMFRATSQLGAAVLAWSLKKREHQASKRSCLQWVQGCFHLDTSGNCHTADFLKNEPRGPAVAFSSHATSFLWGRNLIKCAKAKAMNATHTQSHHVCMCFHSWDNIVL